MPPSSTPKFAFLLLKEHPYGREMLSQLLSENFIPSIVISEDSSIGDKEREKFLKRIEGNPVAPTIPLLSPEKITFLMQFNPGCFSWSFFHFP